MTSPHTYSDEIEVAGAVVKVEIGYSVSAIIRGCGPSFSSGGEPDSGGEVEIQEVTLLIDKGFGANATVERIKAPDWLVNILQEDDDLTYRLFEASCEGDDGSDYAYEEARDERDAA